MLLFVERCGHGVDHTVQSDDRSPVFLQFLDVLYQLLHQFPCAFEYNEQLLLFLADQSHACLFGNFLGNSDRQRCFEMDVHSQTRCIWAYVMRKQSSSSGRSSLMNSSNGYNSSAEDFINKQYVAYGQPIWPATGVASMQLWARYWLRWDATAHPNNLSNQAQWHDDWYDNDD